MKTKKYNVAVVGATGAVGNTLLSILEQRDFPLKTLHVLASERSSGQEIEFKGELLTVEDVADFDFSQVQIAWFTAGSAVSAHYVPIATAAGCIVIDNTSQFRYEEDVPLVITEINPHAIAQYEQRNIIANPNCSTMQMLVALNPIQQAVGIARINVATYQSVSGAGRSGIKELAEQTGLLLNGRPVKRSKAFAVPIAFNVIPQVDTFQENGYTREEMKMVWETHKIFEDGSIQVNPTAVRVPVFYGHAEAVHIETRKKLSAKQARQLLNKAPGVTVVDKRVNGGYPTPAREAAGEDAVYVGRIREDISHPLGLNLWVVSDNTRKGAALNAVQIAELLIAEYL